MRLVVKALIHEEYKTSNTQEFIQNNRKLSILIEVYLRVYPHKGNFHIVFRAVSVWVWVSACLQPPELHPFYPEDRLCER